MARSVYQLRRFFIDYDAVFVRHTGQYQYICEKTTRTALYKQTERPETEMSRAFFSGFIKKKKPFFHAGQAAYWSISVHMRKNNPYGISGLSRMKKRFLLFNEA
jgi:hypothetical protein